MKIFFLLFLYFSLFDEIIVINSQYLKKYSVSYHLNLKFPPIINKTVRFQLVEIFNPFEAFMYNSVHGNPVNRIMLMFKNDDKTNIVEIYSSKLTEIWLRVINITDIIPQCDPQNADVAVRNDSWSITLIMNSLGIITDSNPSIQYNTNIVYRVYALPIYPAGNMDTWSSDYQNIRNRKSEIVFNAINKSIDTEYLNQNGVLLYSTDSISGQVNFTLGSRIIRDYLVIVVAYVPLKTPFQYPPVYINGCLTMPENEASCRFFRISYPMYIILGCTIIFVFMALKYDLAQVFICSLIIGLVITVIAWRLLSYQQYYTDLSKIIISFAVVLIVAIICTSTWYWGTKSNGRSRMLFTAIVISMIFLSVIWYPPIRFIPWKGVTLFGVISGILALLFVSFLILFNHLTLTVGSIFISAVLMSLSLSLSNINASIIPFIFIDFYNTILYSNSNWIYYSPLLLDDLIIVILCPLLSFIIGLFLYCIFKSRLRRKDRTTRIPTSGKDNYGAVGHTESNTIQVEYNVVLIEQNIQPAKNHSQPQPGHVNVLLQQRDVTDYNRNVRDAPTGSQLNPPPAYSSIMKMDAVPSAPVPNYYDGPYKQTF